MIALISMLALILFVAVMAFREAQKENQQIELELGQHDLEVSKPAPSSTLTVDHTQKQRVLEARGQ